MALQYINNGCLIQNMNMSSLTIFIGSFLKSSAIITGSDTCESPDSDTVVNMLL